MSLASTYTPILALARAGAVRYALAEYERYGLDKVTDLEDAILLEDIMSLAGRLYKDLALAHSGKKRKEYAAQSSQKYDAAFAKTGGYYSGINAATMALIARVSDEMVADRATAILQKLPAASDLSAEQLYYVEATRSEAYLLLGNHAKASALLRDAIALDPLNYPAHATTLKQFGMIAKARKHSTQWADGFRPPRSVHYSGHMFALEGQGREGLPTLTRAQTDDLIIKISDMIQVHDIAFGYGALAAGSDILIAEALLEEGGELHIILPVPQDPFVEHSVAPYGSDWVKRFDVCLQSARSISLVSSDVPWPFATAASYASRIAMGEAIRNTYALAADAAQLLIWDGETGPVGTGFDAGEWQAQDRPQFHIEYPGERPAPGHLSQTENGKVLILLADENGVSDYDDIEAACKAALKQRDADYTIKQGLHIALNGQGETAFHMANALEQSAVPGGILLSKSAANFLALHGSDDFATDSLGMLDDGQEVFALRAVGHT